MHGTVDGFLGAKGTVANGAVSPKRLVELLAEANAGEARKTIGNVLSGVWKVLEDPTTTTDVRIAYHDALLTRFAVYNSTSRGGAEFSHKRQPYAPYAFLDRHLVHYRDRVLSETNPAFKGMNDSTWLVEMREQVTAGLEMIDPAKYPGPMTARNAAFRAEIAKVMAAPRNTDATPHPDHLAKIGAPRLG